VGAGAAVDGDGVRALLDVDEQPSVGEGLGGAGDAAVQPLDGERSPAAGEADPVGDLADGADPGEFLLVAWHQQDLVLLAGVDRQRERHAREDDDIVNRDQKKTAHRVFTFSRCLRGIRRKDTITVVRDSHRISVVATEIIAWTDEQALRLVPERRL
jgi:hypothetical protein